MAGAATGTAAVAAGVTTGGDDSETGGGGGDRDGDGGGGGDGGAPTRRAVCPGDAPVWFKHGFGQVSREVLGGCYEELLEEFVALERSYGFVVGASKGLKGSYPRPEQVSTWVKDGRGRKLSMVPITDVASFGKEWWSWWQGMQPSWRGERGERVAAEQADWGHLVQPGQNGMLSVVAALYWWGHAEKAAEGGAGSAEWEEAVTEATWVFRHLRGVS
ncbi:hypothetical protein C8R46DRAFT_905053 [Mycena filopes]|nr:hypothetical protein C8R46DRAFT_905053 [Mycena filopes]